MAAARVISRRVKVLGNEDGTATTVRARARGTGPRRDPPLESWRGRPCRARGRPGRCRRRGPPPRGTRRADIRPHGARRVHRDFGPTPSRSCWRNSNAADGERHRLPVQTNNTSSIPPRSHMVPLDVRRDRPPAERDDQERDGGDRRAGDEAATMREPADREPDVASTFRRFVGMESSRLSARAGRSVMEHYGVVLRRSQSTGDGFPCGCADANPRSANSQSPCDAVLKEREQRVTGDADAGRQRALVPRRWPAAAAGCSDEVGHGGCRLRHS